MLLLLECLFLFSSLPIVSILGDVFTSPERYSWHGNYAHRLRNNASRCNEYHDQHDKMDLAKLIKKYHLWPGKVHSRNLQGIDNGLGASVRANTTLYGMEYGLDAIWEHQHPKNCSAASFFIAAPHDGGFGSVIHVYGAALGASMALGRVFLPHPYDANTWQYNTPHCTEQSIDPLTNKTVTTKIHNLDCYYEPWSSCTIYDALGPNAMNIIEKGAIERFELSHRVVGYLDDKDFIQIIKNGTDKFKTMLAFHNERYSHGVIPLSLMPMLTCSPIPKERWYYWWRAISSTYLMRLNAKTATWLQEHLLPDLDIENDIFTSIYVRRGDKDIEMHMVPVVEYLNATEILWRDYIADNVSANSVVVTTSTTTIDASNGKHKHEHKNHQMYTKRKIFLATEDTPVLEEIIAWGNSSYSNFTAFSHGEKNRQEADTMSSSPVSIDHFYDIHYTNLFNRSGLWAEKHILYKHNKRNVPVHHPEEYLSMILNIHYLIHASGWVCTLASNFCRLVDELRTTLSARADLAFIDLSRESCPSKFCAYEGISNYGW